MPIATRTFRVFVSSTFEDLKEERDVLQRDVFPKLRVLCEQQGARFQAIDLRWGVRDEAALDQRTMGICLTEIDRCQRTRIKPNFIILLGDRYGWRPLASRIERLEFDRVFAHISNSADRTLIGAWYALDQNADPPEYVLLPRTGKFTDSSRWQTLEAEMHRLLCDAAHLAGLSGEALVKYEASATHQEILKGLGHAPEDRSHVFAFFRSGDDAGQDPELADLKALLRNQLRGNAIEFEAGDMEMLSQSVTRCLREMILREIARFQAKPPLDAEIEAHFDFALDRAMHFAGRKSTLTTIKDYLRGDERRPLVLRGESGSGKSAVVARAAAAASNEQPSAVVITRFIGITPDSSSGVRLLRSLCEHISREYGRSEEAPASYEPLAAAFRDRLALATPDRPLVVFVDAMDQLASNDPAAAVAWIPRELAPNVRVVISTVDVSPALHDSSIVELPLLPIEDAEQAVADRLKGANRVLQPSQREWLLSHFSRCGLPLYLKMAFEEARLWRSFASLEQCRLGEGVAGVIDTLLDRLEDNGNHGPTLTSHSLGYLAAARYGLTEDEMLDLLSADKQVWEDFRARARHTPPEQRIPVVVWSRFSLDFEPYLTERSAPGGVVVAFHHRQVAQHIGLRYMAAEERRVRHAAMARYFNAQPNHFDDSHTRPNGRKAGELVHQFLAAGMQDEAVGALTDLQFVAASSAVGLVFDLQRDYHATIAALPESQAELAEEARRKDEAWRWTREIIQYARGAGTGSSLPEVIESVTPWTDEQISAEARRIQDKPTRLDRLRAFGGFVETECYPLIELGPRPGFVVQHAWNYAPAGPVHDQATALADAENASLMLRRWPGGAAYNPKTALLRTLEGHLWEVLCVGVTPDGRRAVSASPDKTLRVWDLDSGACLRTLEGHSEAVWSLSVTPDGRRAVSAGHDCTLRLWDLDSGACLRIFEGHTDMVNSVSMTPDGRRAVSAGYDCTLRLWDLDTGVCLRVLEGHTDWVNSVSLTPDGRRAVSAARDKTVRLWNLDSGACLCTLEGHSGGVSGVTVTPDGSRAISASSDETLKLWDLDSGRCLRTLEGHAEWVASVSMTPDGLLAVSAGGDKTLRLWDLTSGACLRTLEGHSETIWSLSVTPDGCRAVSASIDRTLKFWDLESGACTRTLDGNTPSGRGLSVTPDGRRAVSSCSEKLRLWDLDCEACIRTLEGHTNEIWSVSLTPDGRRAVSAAEDGTLRLWDLESGACLHNLEGHTSAVWNVSVTPEGHRTVSAGRDGTLRLWDLVTGACLRILEGHTDSVSSASVAPDGACVVSASLDGTLRLWDLTSGACLRTLEGHASGVHSVNVMPDGRHAVSAGYDNLLRVWDLDSGACLRSFEGHPDFGNSVSVTPDCRRAVSACSDKTLRLWDLDTGAYFALVRLSAPSKAAVFGVRGPVVFVAAGTSAGGLITFDLRSGAFDPPDAPPAPADYGLDLEQRLLHEFNACRDYWGESHLNTRMAQAALLDRQSKPDEAAEIRRRLKVKSEPYEHLTQAMKEYYVGDYASAAAKLQELLEDGYELTNTHCQMALVLLMLGRDADARDHIAEAWRHRDQAEPHVLGRAHFLNVLFTLLDGRDTSAAIVALEKEICGGDGYPRGIIEPVLRRFAPRISATDVEFLRALADTMLVGGRLPELRQFQRWRDAGL